MAYDHGAFRVRDLEAAVRFYTEKLGFQFLFYSGSEEAGEKGAFLDYRGARLELIETIGAGLCSRPAGAALLSPPLL